MIDLLEDIVNGINVKNRERLDASLLKNVEINLDKSCEEDIVFYRINKGKEASRMLLARLDQGNPGFVVFNGSPDVFIERPYAVVSEKNFFDLQKKNL